MNIYIILEDTEQNTKAQSMTINFGNGGLPKTLDATRISIVSKDEAMQILSPTVVPEVAAEPEAETTPTID